MSEAVFVPITSDHLGGVIAVNVVAGIASLALIAVAIRVVWLAIRRPWSKSPSEYVFFNTQLGQYVTCFIFAMLFNTVSGILGFPWVFMKGIRDGPLCRTQAFLMAVGTSALGFFTIAIAIHSFCALVLEKRQSPTVCRSAICIGWGLSILTASIPFAIHSPEGSVYGPDSFVCGIRPIFPKLVFFFHLLPILLASLLGIVLYSLTFFFLRGTLKFTRGVRLTLNPTKRADWERAEIYHRFIVNLSKSMLWYPVAYIIFLVPYAMLRLFIISGFNMSFEVMVFAFICWYLLSVVEVPLLYNTFQLLGKAFDGVSKRNTQKRGKSTRNARNEADSFFSGDSQQDYPVDVEKRQLLSILPPIQSSSSLNLFDDIFLEFGHSRYSDTASSHHTEPVIPISVSRCDYLEDTTDRSVFRSSDSTIGSFEQLPPPVIDSSNASRPRPPRAPPRSHISPLTKPLMRQMLSTAPETRRTSSLTAPQPTFLSAKFF